MKCPICGMKMEREEVLERKVVHKKKKGEWEPHENNNSGNRILLPCLWISFSMEKAAQATTHSRSFR